MVIVALIWGLRLQISWSLVSRRTSLADRRCVHGSQSEGIDPAALTWIVCVVDPEGADETTCQAMADFERRVKRQRTSDKDRLD